LQLPYNGVCHAIYEAGIGTEMKIAIAAFFSAEGDMDVNSGHGTIFLKRVTLIFMQRLHLANIIPFLLFYFLISCLHAQDSLKWRLCPDTLISTDSDMKNMYASREEALNEANLYVGQLRLHGYLESGIDSISQERHCIFLHTGRKYEWLNLTIREGESSISDGLADLHRFDGKEVNSESLFGLAERLLSTAEDNGYPFAKVYLDSILIVNSKISAQLVVDRGPLILFDTLVIAGDARISSSYLTQYLGIKPGSPYSEQAIRDIRQKISVLAFLELVGDPRVYFSKRGAKLVLPLRNSGGSRFDFLIGVLPGNESNGGKLLINGRADLALLNPFSSGKEIYFLWQNPRVLSPQIDLRFEGPYLFSMPVGVDYRFHLMKYDTSYLLLEHIAGISWFYEGGNYLKFILQRQSSSLITVDEAYLRQSQKLPDILDYVVLGSGLEWSARHLDQLYNPRKGYEARINMTGGRKRVQANPNIVALDDSLLDFHKQYENLSGGNGIVRTELDLSRFFPLGRQGTFLARMRSGILLGKNILQNELYLLGGARQLRGFDEQSLQASKYGMLTFEYRYLFGRYAYLGSFLDMAYIRDESGAVIKQSWPMGLGVNLALDTKAGIFLLSYALGKRDTDELFKIRSGKIHFGYQSYF